MATRRVPTKVLVKQEAALKLYVAGHTYAVIATAVGYSSASSACNAVTSAIARHTQEREELASHALQISLEKYGALFKAAFAKAVGGDWEAMRVAVKILERIDRLQGNELPAQVNVVATVRSELDAEIEQMIAGFTEPQKAIGK